MKILVIHGPNLGELGEREPLIYGTRTLSEINKIIIREADKLKIDIEIVQSDIEGEIINWIKRDDLNIDGLVINPAGYSYSSIAIRDAILLAKLPTVEVHMTNIFSREKFRQKSIIAPIAIGQISGFGMYSYILGMNALVYWLENNANKKV